MHLNVGQLIATWPVLASSPTRDVEEFVTEFRYVPEGWLGVAALALLAGVCWAVIWMYRREGRIGATHRMRISLAVVRCLVFVTLAVIFLEPVRVRILRRWIDSYTVLLVDSSSSMDLADLYNDETAAARVERVTEASPSSPIRRSDIAEALLTRKDRKLIHDLTARNRVKYYTFASEPKLQATVRASRERGAPQKASTGGQPQLVGVDEVPLKIEATGAATNIDRSLRRAVESLGSAPIAGVVVLSDGGFNEGAPAEDTARYASERKLPVYAVGIGDPSSPRNVRVTEVLAPENAFKQDPFVVSAQFASQGIDGETLRVELRETDASGSGEGRLVDTRTVTVGPGGVIEPVSFRRKQDRVGRYTYTVNVPVVDRESVADDNSRQTTVNVIDSRTRVLLVAGGPSWDYRFVARLLERDESMDVSCWLQSADINAVRDGNTVIDHLPRLAEELYAYDVVIMMDPDPAAIDSEWCRLIDTLVTEYGGGFLYTAGRARTPAFMRDPRLKPLHDILPVTLDPEADLISNEIGHYQLKPSPIEIPQTAYAHPVLQLENDTASTRLAWRGVDSIYWHYPVLREKPVATVLMRDGNPRMRNSAGGHVLVATQFVGAGRTGMIAFDGTWRWRKHGEELFDRFWVQLVRSLGEGKLLGGTKRGMLMTESDQFSLGEAVTLTARLFNERYEPLNRERVPAYYEIEGERTDLELMARPDRPGWFEGRIVPDRTGTYRISVRLPGGGGADASEIVRVIRVSRPNIEILRPQMDRAELMTLADQSHGGKYFDIDEATALADRIPDLHEEIPIRSRPTTLWDRWVTLGWLVALLSVEWFLRKWNRLL